MYIMGVLRYTAQALEAAYSPQAEMMDVISEIRSVCVKSHITLRVRWIEGEVFNVIADSLSHDDFHQARLAARSEFGLAMEARERSPRGLRSCQ
jgi:hypothetical protein